MFKPDEPIKSAKDDLLGRARFARSFSDALLNYQDKRSMVAALYGDWGAGKTSVVNMVLEHINVSSKKLPETKRPIVIRFNPWNYSDQTQLVAQFFRALSYGLKRENYGPQAKEIGEKLETYSNFFTPISLIPFPYAAAIAIIFKHVFSSVGKAAKAWGVAYTKDLAATKEDLDKALEAQERKIIVVIDDIDRLANVEIRQVFQLVKMLGDFPNSIYLLAFDRSVVVKALGQVQEGKGEDYLEKIVQFPIELPPITRTELEKLLFAQLDQIIKDVPKERWNDGHWAAVHREGLRHFFGTLRDLTRYINVLRFSFELVRDDVNPVDFTAMTAIQVFEPSLYKGIRDNKDLFSGALSESLLGEKAERKQAQARIDEIIDRTTVLSSAGARNLLERLFPRVEEVYSNVSYGGELFNEWRLQDRICHPERFDIYFNLAMPPGDIPNTEMGALLKLSSDGRAFSEALLKLSDDGRVVRFLDLMEDHTREISNKKNALNIIGALMNVGDLFPQGPTGGFEFGTPIRIVRVVRQLLVKRGSQEERYELLEKAILKTKVSIYTVVQIVAILAHEGSGKGDRLIPESERLFNEKQTKKLERLAVKKIETWAKKKSLAKSSHLAEILRAWNRWADDNGRELHSFVSRTIEHDDSLVLFVTAFVQNVQSRNLRDYVSTVDKYLDFETMKEFVDTDKLKKRLELVAKSNSFSGYTSEQQEAVGLFLNDVTRNKVFS